MECAFDTYKSALIKNSVILFVLLCAIEPIYFLTDRFFDLIFILFSYVLLIFCRQQQHFSISIEATINIIIPFYVIIHIQNNNNIENNNSNNFTISNNKSNNDNNSNGTNDTINNNSDINGIDNNDNNDINNNTSSNSSNNNNNHTNDTNDIIINNSNNTNDTINNNNSNSSNNNNNTIDINDITNNSNNNNDNDVVSGIWILWQFRFQLDFKNSLRSRLKRHADFDPRSRILRSAFRTDHPYTPSEKVRYS